MRAKRLVEDVEWVNGGGFYWVGTNWVLTLRIPRELPCVCRHLELIRVVQMPRSCLGSRWRPGSRYVMS